MFASATFRDRLPSAAAAIALQAGLLALLLLSFEAVRHITEEQEHTIFLPPLLRPVPQNRARVTPRREPETALPPPVTAQPLPPQTVIPEAAPGGGTGIQMAQPPGTIDCRPENYVHLNGSDRAACTRAWEKPRDDKTMVMDPNPPVKNAPIWQSEIERRNTPPRVPCVSLTSGAVGEGGYVREDHGVRLDISCALKALREGPQILPPIRGEPDPNPPPQHASDDAFSKALQAVNARKRALYARPAPPDTIAGASP